MSDKEDRTSGLGLVLSLVGIAVAVLAAGMGFVVHGISQTQSRVHALQGTFQAGESIVAKLENSRFLEQALPTHGSAIYVSSAPRKLFCISVFRSANGTLRLGRALAASDEVVRMEDLTARLRELRSSLGECDEVGFTIHSGQTPYRGTVRVHYDPELKIRSVDLRYFRD